MTAAGGRGGSAVRAPLRSLKKSAAVPWSVRLRALSVYPYEQCGDLLPASGRLALFSVCCWSGGECPSLQTAAAALLPCRPLLPC